MDWLRQLFEHPADPLLLAGSYDTNLVLLSFLIAVFSSAIALQTTAQAISVKKRNLRLMMLGTGSIALGGGVWAMHFIGMLAFALCTPVSYSPGLTFFSMVPSVAASWVALDLISKKRLGPLQLLLGGVLVGAGIGTMHYAGMAAMQMAVALRYDLLMFLLSIVVAVVLAVLALWVRFGLKRFNLSASALTLISAVVMGAAITGMHYTGMAAARFVPPPGFVPANESNSISWLLAMGITFTTIVITGLVVAVNLLIKYREMSTLAKANESRLLAMMETAVDGIVTIDTNGHIQGVNRAAEQILGWREAELLQKNVNIITPAEIKPHHDDFIQNYLKTGSAKIIGVGRDVEALHKNGHRIPVRLAIGHARLPGEDIFVAFITDISSRLQMESALRENEAKFRSLIGNIPGAAYRCLYNESWDMLFISDAIEQLCGYPASDFMLPDPKRSWSDLVHPEDKATTMQLDLYKGSFTLEYRIRHKDGSWRWILEHGEAITADNGDIVWLDGFLMDISQRKLMEVELLQAKNNAEHAAEARSAFLANMSHEIRTPMNAIIGFSDLLLTTDMPAQSKKHLETIHSSARSLLHLLNDILDSAKLEKGKLELEMADFSLPALLDTVVSTLWLQARKKQLDLKLELSPEVGEFYYGAPDRLRQVLTNLLGNAIKFTEQGGVTVHVSAAADMQLTFRVTDTGIGIASERLPYIFDAFTQADASMSRRFGGTGLGTTISKQLVELMGGQIGVESTEGEGSSFWFSLPLQVGKGRSAMFSSSAVQLPPLAVLIADDIAQNLELLQLLLERAGHQVTAVSNGQQALDAVQQQDFDLVLMDIQMPDMDGLEACQKIRQWETQNQRQPLPIVALTASVLEEDKTAAKAAGMQGFASKPVDFAVLSAEMARVLNLDIATEHLTHSSSDAQIVASAQALNLNKALQLWGSLARYLPQLQQFLQQQAVALQQAQQQLQAGKLDQVRSIAHAVKGVSANLGLELLSKLSSELEQAARQRQTERCSGLLQDLLLSWPQYQALYQRLLNEQHNDAEKRATPLDDAQLTAALERLMQALSQHELDDEVLDILANYQGHWHEQILSLLDAVNDFDFTLALERLARLQQNLTTGAD